MFKNKKYQNKKWQARRQLYKGRFYYFKKIMQVVFGLAVVVGLVAIVFYVRNSTALGIKTVEVLGNIEHMSKDDVIKLSGIRKTDKLFVLNLGKVQRNLRRHHWIKEVRVRREFPSTIQIHITERKPLAILLAEDLYLVDEGGKVFKKVESGDPLDLPVMTGFSKKGLKDYPYLMKEFLLSSVEFLKFLNQQNFYQDDVVSEVHFDQVFGYTVYTKKLGLEIFYGRNEIKTKQERLEKFKLSKYYKEMGFARLDLDSGNKVIGRMF